MYVFDFAGAVVFLLSLIAISRFKKYVTVEDKESYNHVVTGLVILATLSLCKISSDFGLFSGAPFLSEPLFFKLLFWIGMFTGLVFLINGVSNWAPLSRSYRKYNKERIQKLEFIRKVEQLLRVESRTPVVLKKTLEHMAASYSLAQGAAYLYSRKRGAVVWLGSADTEDASTTSLGEITFNREAVKGYPEDHHLEPQSLIERLPEDVQMPEMAIPIITGDYLIGFFLLWTRQSMPISDEDRINLKIVGDIIGHEICHEFLQMQHDFQHELDLWAADLKSKMDYRRSPQHNVTTIADSLRRRMDIDYISVTVVRDKGTAARFSIGDNGGLLTETNVDFENCASVVRNVYEQGEPLYVDDLDQQPALGLDKMLVRSGYRTLTVLPIRHGCHIEGVVTLAAREACAIAKGQRRFIDACLPAVGGLASAERYRFEIRRKERRGYILNNLMGKIVELENPEEVFTTAANIIETELRPSVVRISSVDRKGAFLESLALQMAESGTAMLTPARGAMILSLMPYHQLVLETGRPMMINQQSTDRRMTESESRQVFGVELNSALLVPVKDGSTAVGVISLAETREWSKHQYTQDDVQFVTAIASTLSVALQLARTKQESRLPAKRKVGKFDPEIYARTRARGRIKSSLTGIIGSVEFLKTHKQPTENDLEKCLGIIDRSARRIGEYVTTEVEE